MIAGALEIQLRADIARLQRDMDDARRVVGGAMDSITRVVSVARGALAGLAAGFSLGALAHQVVDAQREFDKLNASLITATGSTANAAGAFKALQAFAATTPYSVAEATEAFIKMRNLGLDPSEKALRSYGNTAAAMGKGLNQMIEAVADAATGEFERLKEFGITAKQNGDKVSLTFQGMTSTIGNNANEIQGYLRKLGDVDFAGAMDRRADTLDGAISNLGDSWNGLVLKVSQSGIGDALRGAVSQLSDALGSLGDSVGKLTGALTTGAKIGAAYVAVFIAAPAIFGAAATAIGAMQLQLALVNMAMASGVGVGGLLSISLNGVSVSAQLAAGSLSKLKLAGGLLFAAFAGWEIGSYLSENFVEARLAGLTFVGVMLKGWENVKYGAQMTWEAIGFAWDKTVSTMKASFAGFLSGVASGLNLVGAKETSKEVAAYADQLRSAAAAQGTFADRTASMTAAHKAATDEIDNNIVELMQYEMTTKKVANTELGQHQIVLTAEQKRAKAKQDILEIENRLNGVNAQTAGELTKLKAALDAGAISQAEYGKYAAKINKEARENSTAYKDAVKQIDLQTAALQRQAAARNYDNQQAQQQIDFLKRTGQLNDEDAINKGADADLGKMRADKAALEQQIKLQAQKIGNEEKVGGLRDQRAQLDKDIDARELKRGNDLFELDQKRYREAVGNSAELIEAAQAETKAQQDRTRDQQDEIDALGLTAKQIAELTAARLRDRAAALDAAASELSILDEVADARRKQADELRKQANQTIQKDELVRQKEIWSSIEQTAHDTFVSIFDSGKSAFDRLRDTLKNGLLDLLYQMTVKQWIINIGAAVTGGGVAGVAAAATGGGSSAGGALSGLGALGSITSGVGLLGAGGLGLQAGFGALMTSGLAGISGAVSGGIAAIGAGTSASIAAGMGTIAGALGPIGLGVAGIVALVNKLDHSGTPHTGGAASASATGAQSIDAGTLGLQKIDTSAAAQELTSKLASSVVAILDSTASTFGKTAGYTAATAFADDSSKDGAWGALIISNLNGMVSQWGDANSKWAPSVFADGAQGQQQYLDAISKSTRAALDQIGLPSWAQKMLDSLGDAPALEDLAKAVDAINSTEKALAVMGERLVGFGKLSDEATSALLSAAGGIDALAANASAYYDAFYSESEKTKVLAGQVADALQKVGVAMPATREEYRAQVEAQLALGTAGAPAVAALLGVAGAINQLYPAAQAAKSAVETQNSLLELQAQIYELTGDKAAAAAVLQQQHAAALAETDPALRAATQQLWDLQAAAKAVEQVQADASTLLGGVDSAFSVLQKVVDREKQAVQASIDVHTASVTRLQSLASSLSSTLNSMRSPEQLVTARADGQAQIRAAVAAARAGGALPDADSLKDALSAVQQDASDQFSSYTDYLRDLYTTQNDIGSLAGITDNQLTVEQQALEKAKAQLESLDGILTHAQDQLDELKGQSTTLLSIDQAIGGLAAAIRAAQQNPVVAATADINKAYQTALGRAPDAAGMQFWQGQAAAGTSTSDIVGAITGSAEAKNRAAIQKLYQDLLGRPADDAGLSFFGSSGASLSDIAASIKKSDEFKAKVPGYANGGDFAGGVRLVGEVGPEIEVTGASRIHSTQSLMDALRNPSDNGAVLADAVDRLTATVERQRVTIEQQGVALDQIQRNTRRSADTMDVVTEGGNAMRTKEQV
nr:DUF4214 domain-containing protein [uncultured Massilia sp.]